MINVVLIVRKFLCSFLLPFRKRFLFFPIFIFFISGCSGNNDNGGSSSNPRPIPSPNTTIKSPKIVDVRLESTKELYGLGDDVGILIDFDQKVVVHSNENSVPRISLVISGVPRQAEYHLGTGTKTLLFRHKIVVEDGNSDEIEMASAIDLNGSSISNSEGKAAILTLTKIKIGGTDVRIPSRHLNLSLHNPLISPSIDSTPEILVSGVEPYASVQLYSDNSCSVGASSSVLVPQNASSIFIEADVLTDGSFVTYYARQTDVAGNISDCSSRSVSYNYDGTLPITPSGLNLHSPSNNPSNDSTPEILVSGVEPNVFVQLYSDNSCSVGASSSVLVPQSDSSVIVEVNVLTSDGIFTYYARQTDLAGNPSPCSTTSISYTYDGTLPMTPSGLSQHNPLTGPFTDTTPEILVSGVEPYASVQLYSDNSCSVSTSSSVLVPQSDSSVIIEVNAITSDGTFTYYARQTDLAGNLSDCSLSKVTYQYISPPNIVNIEIEDGSYLSGDTLDIRIEFSRNVIVNTSLGFPRLSLTIGEDEKYATYSSGSGSLELIFTYNIGQVDFDNDGIKINGLIDLNGGTIKDNYLIDALLTFTSPQNFNRVFVNFKEEIFSNGWAFALLRSGGSVITWGDSRYGGDSSSVSDSLTSGVDTIFSNGNAFAALKIDGSVVTWGYSSSGGDSSSVSDSLTSGVDTIFSTGGAFAALKNDGSVITWGNRVSGGDSSSVSESLTSGVDTIFLTGGAFAALKSDGSVITWGNRVYGSDSSLVSESLTSGVKTIFSNYNAFAALKSDGSVITAELHEIDPPNCTKIDPPKQPSNSMHNFQWHKWSNFVKLNLLFLPI